MNSPNPVNPAPGAGEHGQGDAMPAQFWQRVKQLFVEALPLDPSARQALLDTACGGNPGLRAEVESLLAFANQTAISRPPVAPEPSPLAAGTRLGDYEVLSLLGSGGFGGRIAPATFACGATPPSRFCPRLSPPM